MDSNLPANAGFEPWSKKIHLAGATKAFRHDSWALALAPASHSYWTHEMQPWSAPGAYASRQEKPPMRSPWPSGFRWELPPTPTRSSLHAVQRPGTTKTNKQFSFFIKSASWTSLVAQWLRICLPVQWTWVWSLVWDPGRSHMPWSDWAGATQLLNPCPSELSSHHHWTLTPGASASPQEKPRRRGAREAPTRHS